MKLEEHKIKKILIIRPDMIGDVVLITPAIAALKIKFPSARISVLAQEYTRGVLEGNPDVSEIIIDEIKDGKIANIFQYFSYVKKIRRMAFDLCINYYPDTLNYAALPFLARIPYRIADKARILISWMYNVGTFIKGKDITRHIIEVNLELLKPLSLDVSDKKPRVFISEEDRKAVSEKLSAKGVSSGDLLIGIHLGTGGSNKPWSSEGYAAVCDILKEKLNAKVIITGGPKEKPVAEEVMTLSKHKPVNMVEETTLNELFALIERYKVYVGVDTGPFHVAAALNIPIVAIFPSKNVRPTKWGPWMTRNIVLHDPTKCREVCFPRKCSLNTCLDDITPLEVTSAVEKLLSGGGNRTENESFMDWRKKSLNILVTCHSKEKADVDRAIDIVKKLSKDGYNVVALTRNGSEVSKLLEPLHVVTYELDISTPNPFVVKKLLCVMVREDINVLHAVGQPGRFNLVLSFLLSGLFMPTSVLYVKDKAEVLAGGDDIADYYTRQFQKALI